LQNHDNAIDIRNQDDESANSCDFHFSSLLCAIGPGSRYFCESLFWASQPKQAAEITRLLMPDDAPIRPAALVATQQEGSTTLHNDFTPLSGSLLFSLRKLRENIQPCGAIGGYRPSRSLSMADSKCAAPRVGALGGMKRVALVMSRTFQENACPVRPSLRAAYRRAQHGSGHEKCAGR
jgi:hypothetical protein